MIYSAENFPTSFTSADGTEYPIHSDFREWIRFESLITNADVPENLKFFIALRLIFADNVPENFHAAHEFIGWFYRGGKELPDSRKAFLMDMQELFELPVSLTEQRRIEAARKFLES